jgi:hypothetical protein
MVLSWGAEVDVQTGRAISSANDHWIESIASAVLAAWPFEQYGMEISNELLLQPSNPNQPRGSIELLPGYSERYATLNTAFKDLHRELVLLRLD